MKWTIGIMASVTIITCCLGVSSAQILRIGTSEWRPWQIVEREILTGITPDILQEISRRTGYTMKIEILPQKRMMGKFKLQQIDLEPTVNPAWRKTQEDISVYTSPFYTTRDIILVRKGSDIKGASAQDFKGLTLGCGLGYFYPEGFQEAFNIGNIIREDNRISEQNLKKLSLKRIDGIIIDKIQANYLFKTFKLSREDFAIAYNFQPSKLSFRLHKSKKELLATLNKAIEGMVADGTIERIVMKFTN